MHRDYTIIGKIFRVPVDTAKDLTWELVRVKKADYHFVFYVNDTTGYRVLNQVREPLLDQFAEDQDDV
jgi:hypothetical protein